MNNELAIRTEKLGRVYKLKPNRQEKKEARKSGREAPRTKELVALEDVTLDVGAGEIFGLLGPNGAGKTTLIKILATLLSPSSGKAWVGGLDVETHAADIRRLINMVAGGETSGYGLLTVRENLWMFSQFYGLTHKTTNERIDALLHVVGLEDKRNTKISDLSTGLRQKMNFVRGFITEPQIIFLDEPTLGLDVSAAREVRAYVKRWVTEHPEKTVLLTTHYMAEADELCDRVAIIDRGRILGCDTPFNLKHALQRDAVFRLQVTYLPDAATVVSAIQGVRQCIHRHLNDHTELNMILEAEDVLAPVISALSAQEARLLSLEKREPTLEDVFVTMVGRGLNEDTSQEPGSD